MWSDESQTAVLNLITALNRVIGEEDNKVHARFFFEVIRSDELRQYVPETPRAEDTWKIIEDLCAEVTLVANAGSRTPDRYKLTIALCNALKATVHPNHRR